MTAAGSAGEDLPLVDWDIGMAAAPGWIPLPMEAEQDGTLDEAVSELLAQGRIQPMYASGALDWLEQTAIATRETGGIVAQALVHELDTGLVTALFVARVHVHDQPDDRQRSIDEWATFAARPEPTDLTTREVDVIELGAGPAVRARFRTRGGGAHEQTVALDIVAYWVPVPGHDATALLTGTSGELIYADTLAELYDSIAATVSFPAIDRSGASG